VGLREICVPATIQDSLPADERRALLAHEVGHLARRDPLWFAVAGSLARLAVFQPLNRFALARLRQASEEAADDFAAQATGNPEALARALAGLASVLTLQSAGVAATGSPVVERVSRLLDERTRAPRPWRRSVRVAASGAALTLLISFAPGVTVSVDDLADRLPWLTPSREEPNARMLDVRRMTREWRELVRHPLR
jgi:beta-lactamase regulating signal transducer with metallopeptidase domain